MASRKFRFLEAENNKRPPDYSSRANQRKLMMLIATLFLVLFAMQQAGRPESWQWLVRLGKSSESQGPEIAVADRTTEPPGFSTAQETWTTVLPGTGDLTLEQWKAWQNLEGQFWDTALERLEPSEQFVLVHWIGKAADIGSTSGEDGPGNDLQVAAVQGLVRMREQFLDEVKRLAAFGASIQQLESDPESNPNGSPDSRPDDESLPDLAASSGTSVNLFDLPDQVSLAVAQVAEDQTRWLIRQCSLVPGVRSSGQPDDGNLFPEGDEQQRANAALWKDLLERRIDPFLISRVQDGTRIGRPAERATWLRLVQRATRSESQGESVTRQNLMGQPDYFRGQWVQLEGTLRRIDTRRQRSDEVAHWMGDQDYLVAWIQPSISGQGPYCVYCLDDPELRQLAEASSDQRRGIKVQGIFYKLFPYAVSETETAMGPLLVAQRVSLATVAPTRPPANPPTTGQWGLILAGVGLLAATLGMLAWVSTRYRSANPIGQRLYRSSKVDWLAGQPVDSIGESLRELERKAEDAGDGPPTNQENPSGESQQ